MVVTKEDVVVLVDAVAIAVIVSINAAVGYYQEARAQREMVALRSLAARRARVVRDGKGLVIAASAIVPGDVLVLEAGDVVGADAVLLDTADLRINESALTGESGLVDDVDAGLHGVDGLGGASLW